MSDLPQHWNTIFATKSDSELGWYEPDVSQTTKFFHHIPSLEKQTVFIAGAGTTVLADYLYGKCRHLILNDISSQALSKLRDRLAAGADITWLPHDISQPLPAEVCGIDLWIDRAVLHFLLTDSQIVNYFQNVRRTVAINGFVLLAQFASDGAPKCAGLELHRYSCLEFSQRLGDGFGLIAEEKHTFINPSGSPRPYIYALFQRLDS